MLGGKFIRLVGVDGDRLRDPGSPNERSGMLTLDSWSMRLCFALPNRCFR
jgi:hypothetical protein